MVDVNSGSGVSVPLSDIEGKECFIDMASRLLDKIFKVCCKIFDEIVVKILAEQMRCTL
jgi:hypothetical protein